MPETKAERVARFASNSCNGRGRGASQSYAFCPGLRFSSAVQRGLHRFRLWPLLATQGRGARNWTGDIDDDREGSGGDDGRSPHCPAGR